MSETKYSSSSSPADSWAHEFYNHNVTMFGGGRERVSSEATVISTTASGSTTSNILSHHGSSSSNTAGQYLNVPADQGAGGGRASKPIRRRSRASRRTPTTLLNTDTTNFRAMVQQFTGGPAVPYASAAAGSHPQYPFPRGGSNFSFGVESRNQILNPTPSAGAFYHLQFQQQQQQQQQQQREQQQHEPYYQQQHQPYMFSFMNNNSRPEMEDVNNQAAGGFSIDHVPFPDLPHPRPPSSMP